MIEKLVFFGGFVPSTEHLYTVTDSCTLFRDHARKHFKYGWPMLVVNAPCDHEVHPWPLLKAKRLHPCEGYISADGVLTMRKPRVHKQIRLVPSKSLVRCISES